MPHKITAPRGLSTFFSQQSLTAPFPRSRLPLMFSLKIDEWAWLTRRLGAASFQLQAGPDQKHHGLITIEQCAQAIEATYREYHLFW